MAEASALSSAPNTTSRVTFFSRAKASTNRRISRLIAFALEIQNGVQFCALDIVEREVQHLHFVLLCLKFETEHGLLRLAGLRLGVILGTTSVPEKTCVHPWPRAA